MDALVPMRRLVAVVAVTALVASGVGVALASHQFRDVGSGNFFHDEIAAIVDGGCATGFNDNTFKPADPATRGQFAYWTSNCGARVAHKSGVVDLEPGTDQFRDIVVEPGAVGSGSAFVVLTVSWYAVSQGITEGASATAPDKPEVQLLGAPPPCPCRVTVSPRIREPDGHGLGITRDVWPTDASTRLDPDMFLSASDTFVEPITGGEQVTLGAKFRYEPTNDSFAENVRVVYRITAVVVPFGWDGTQNLQPPP
jgi:hypothetical protein